MLRLLNESDWDAMLDYIQRHELETTFFYSNIQAYGVENRFDIGRSGDYIGHFADGCLTGIIAFYNMGSCVPHYENEATMDVFIWMMKQRQFKYLLGTARIIRPLLDKLHIEKDIESVIEGGYYINHNFVDFYIDDTEFIDATEVDEDTATAFIVEAYSRGFNQNKTKEEALRMVRESTDSEAVVFMRKQGAIVAQGCIHAVTDCLGQIGSVYTEPTVRGLGYGKAICAELCRRVIAMDKTPTFMLKNDSSPVASAYRALGFEKYDDYYIITLHAGDEG